MTSEDIKHQLIINRHTRARAHTHTYTHTLYVYIMSCTISRHFKQSHIHRMHACFAVTCHLHFRQNDRDILHAIAVTWGWNGYRNKSQHRKHTPSIPFRRPRCRKPVLGVWPWRRKFSHRSCRDSNPRPFDHESGALTTKLSPLPETVETPTRSGKSTIYENDYWCVDRS